MHSFVQLMFLLFFFFFFFFFNDTATTEIYTLSLHDALPISPRAGRGRRRLSGRPILLGAGPSAGQARFPPPDRKSTRLNSSHLVISYAVFCLKKKKNKLIYFNNRVSYQFVSQLDVDTSTSMP